MNYRRLQGWISLFFKNVLIILICLPLLVQSNMPPGDNVERIRAHTRSIEFDYVNWMLDALWGKYVAFSVSAPRYLSVSQQHTVVLDYLKLVDQIDSVTGKINKVYADPSVKDPAAQSEDLSNQLADLKDQRSHLQPIAESVLQYQVSVIAGEMGLGEGGQLLPPLLYHVTPLPEALIVSPRNVIRQDANISLNPDLTIQQVTNLENSVEKSQNVSALVTDIGGVGVYPTMVMSTTDLPWLLETVSHEWTHNYLTWHPLGANYETSAQLRTMNETTANISGKEIGRAVLDRFYPEIAATLPPPTPPQTEQTQQTPSKPAPENPNVFNFNHEMHLTRVTVDQMLADGKIDEAEAYMETRRQFFWNHGYQIRKLNQAYFAFYGAYADTPGGGAAGQDPVGPAVQKLRSQSSSLADFLSRIAWVTSFDQLQKMLK